MAEITYYFDDGEAQGIYSWDDWEYSFDNILTNYAYTNVDGEWLGLVGNTCLGSDLGTISKVELRAYGYGDGGDQLNLRPIYDGNYGDDHLVTMPSSDDWSIYVDITTGTYMPDWSSWSHIQGLGSRIIFTKSAKANTMHCSKVEIRVTYEPSAEGIVIPILSDKGIHSVIFGGQIIR